MQPQQLVLASLDHSISPSTTNPVIIGKHSIKGILSVSQSFPLCCSLLVRESEVCRSLARLLPATGGSKARDQERLCVGVRRLSLERSTSGRRISVSVRFPLSLLLTLRIELH